MWFTLAIVIAASMVLWGEWAGSFEPAEMCRHHAPDGVGGYHAEAQGWPPRLSRHVRRRRGWAIE